jgi:hypothetical protein
VKPDGATAVIATDVLGPRSRTRRSHSQRLANSEPDLSHAKAATGAVLRRPVGQRWPGRNREVKDARPFSAFDDEKDRGMRGCADRFRMEWDRPLQRTAWTAIEVASCRV